MLCIEHLNEEVKQENSNKNPVINSTQRDYMAGEVSKDLDHAVSCFRKRLCAPMRKVSSISMIPIILHRKSITAT